MDGVEWLLAKWLPSHGYPMGFSALGVFERVFECVVGRVVFLIVLSGSQQHGFQVMGYPMGFNGPWVIVTDFEWFGVIVRDVKWIWIWFLVFLIDSVWFILILSDLWLILNVFLCKIVLSLEPQQYSKKSINISAEVLQKKTTDDTSS